MQIRLFRLLATVLAVFVLQTGISQQVDSMMAVYAAAFPTEKVHVHFDKPIYNKEETIWYKLYILSGEELSSLSKNVYVEWYDTSGYMMGQTVAPLYQSTAKGSFEIPANYAGPFIHMKVYTRWMLNDDPAFSYEKDITIHSPNRGVTNKKTVVLTTRVETFPEGGFLVNSLSTRIAFKATNQYGMPVFMKGLLVNDKNKTLDTLKVKHDGMGSFVVTPQTGESYFLKWTDENGKSGSTPIPAPKLAGANIRIRTTNDKAFVTVERTLNAGAEFTKMKLLVHMNQNLFYTISMNASEKTLLHAVVPIDELPTGILQFSLFTSEWVPIAERIIFINNRMHEFNAKIIPQLINLEKRGKNVFDITVSDTALTNMSVAVTDATIITPETNTIYSDLVLSDDIKGKIYNPAYYLSSDADSITANLDLVMLTNGWRRFDWEKIKAGILPERKYPVETELLAIKGKVFGMKSVSTNTPLLLNLIIIGKDSSKNFAFLPIQKDGSFEQKSAFFYDTARIFYSFNGNAKLTEITQVQFDNGLLKQIRKTIQYPERYLPGSWNDSIAKIKMSYFLDQQEQLKRRMATATLQEVIVKSKVKSKEQLIEEKYATGLFSGGDGYSFNLIDDPSAMSALDILSFLQGKVAGLAISGTGAQATMSWRGSTPDVFLNEMQSSLDMVQSVNVQDIAFVKVFRPPFFGSVGGGSGGAIAIYTKKGNDGNKGVSSGKGLESTILGGYTRFKEFYQPQYDKPTETFETDIRSTLYWNPYVITNKKNPKFRVQFFNNDVSKKLQIVLEGINHDGKMTRAVKLLE